MENIRTLRDLEKLNKLNFENFKELTELLEEIMLDNFNYKYQSFDTTNDSTMLVFHKLEMTSIQTKNDIVNILISDENNNITSVTQTTTGMWVFVNEETEQQGLALR